ncbi:MAG: ABC transporter ATP-binding protein [Phycisphaerae bacterium]
MNQSAHILTAKDLHKSYGRGPARVHVLRGLDLAVRRGEFLAVMGPSGCGKSTLLHVLGLMTEPDRDEAGGLMGVVAIEGAEVHDSAAARNALRRSKIGFVFQRFNLISVLSAADNVAISLSVRGVRDGGQVGELFEALGVAHLKARKPGAMSIGEQQRLAVVRALAHRPAILLADEPTGNLDSANSEALLGIFRDLNRSRGQTIVMITHSADAAACADRIVYMKDGQITRHSA